MGDIRPIETEYDGYRFRSRLEARWAVFFDEMKIKYDYEYEGVELADGTRYLPDFRLHGFCGRGPQKSHKPTILWAEVKGVENESDFYKRKQADLQKIEMFANSGDAYQPANPIIILPNIPDDCFDWWNRGVTTFSYVDGDWEWPCVIIAIDNEEFVLCGPDGDSYPNTGQTETNIALSKARKKRFEYTEQDLQPLEEEVEMLRKRKALLDEKEKLIQELNGNRR